MSCNLCTSMLLYIIQFKIMHYLSLIIHFHSDRIYKWWIQLWVFSKRSCPMDLMASGDSLLRHVDQKLWKIGWGWWYVGSHTSSWEGQHATLFWVIPTETAKENNIFEDKHYGLDNMAKLMSETGNMRSNLLVPGCQRREMASKLAMKTVADDDEEAFEDVRQFI